MQMSIYETMKAHGFADLGRCGACGGSVHKYQNGNVMVYVKPKTNIFRVRIGNQYVTEWKNINELNETIEAHLSAKA